MHCDSWKAEGKESIQNTPLCYSYFLNAKTQSGRTEIAA